MTNVTPLHNRLETVAGALRNALQVAYAFHAGADHKAWVRIAQLIKHALVELSEPNLAAMQAGEVLLREWSGTPEPQRQLRDTVAGILHAQISGVVPKTWEVS